MPAADCATHAQTAGWNAFVGVEPPGRQRPSQAMLVSSAQRAARSASSPSACNNHRRDQTSAGTDGSRGPMGRGLERVIGEESFGGSARQACTLFKSSSSEAVSKRR